jgi:integrase
MGSGSDNRLHYEIPAKEGLIWRARPLRASPGAKLDVASCSSQSVLPDQGDGAAAPDDHMQKKTKRMTTGIRERHRRGCASARGSACSCRPTWEASVWSRRDGRKIRKTFATKAAARAWRAQAESEVRRGRLRAPTGTTFAAAASDLLAGMKDGTIRRKGGDPYKATTLRSYRRSLELYLLPEFGRVRLHQITRNDIEDFLVHLQRERNPDPNVKPLDGSSLRNLVMPARVIFRQAVHRGEIAQNPCLGLELPSPGRRERRVAPPAEFRLFLEQLSTFDRALWSVVYYAGLRLGEVLAIQWGDVDLANGTITVATNWDATERARVPVKTRSGKRRIPMTTALRDHMTEHRASIDGDSFVFAGRTGRPIAQSTVHRRGRKASEAAGVEWTPPQAGRKTYSSHLRAAGADDKEMVAMMGHASIITTKDIYTQLLPGDERRIAEKLERFLERQS